MTSRLGKASFWLASSRALVNLLGFASTIILARFLVPGDFGLIALGTTVLSILSGVTDTQVSQALVNHRNPTAEHLNAAWTLSVLRGLAIGVVLVGCGPVMASIYHDSRLVGVMSAIGLSIFISGFVNPRRVMLQRELVFRQDFVLSVSQRLVTVIVTVVIAAYSRSYWALLIGTIAGQLAQILVSYTVVPFRPSVTFRHLGELWSFSMWLSLSRVVNTLNWRFDQLLVGKFLGGTQLGLYTVGDNLSQLPTRESVQPLSQTLFPAFAKMGSDPERLRNAYRRAQSMIMAVALPLGTGVALVAYPLIGVMMGQKWIGVVQVVQILAVIYAFQTLGSSAQPLALSMGKTKLMFRRDMYLFAVRVPVIILGLYLDGMRGVLIARAISGALAIGFNVRIVRDLIGLSYVSQLLANVRPVTSVILMATSVLLMSAAISGSSPETSELARLILMSMTGAAVYLGSSLALWQIAGRPNGPESEVFTMLGKINKYARRA